MFSLEFFVALDYKNLVDQSGLNSSWHKKKKKKSQTKNCDLFSFIQDLPQVLFLVLENSIFLQGLELVHSAFRPFFAP